MSKRTVDMDYARERRMLVDKEILSLIGGKNWTLLPNVSRGTSRVLSSPTKKINLHYRFFPDPLYLKLPSAKMSLQEGYAFFKEDYFLPLMGIRSTVSSSVILSHLFHAPILIGSIPVMALQKVERCFVKSTSPGNENRLDCVTLNMTQLTFNPMQGSSQGMLEREPGLVECLQDLLQ
jgi:hypothetical protein